MCLMYGWMCRASSTTSPEHVGGNSEPDQTSHTGNCCLLLQETLYEAFSFIGDHDAVRAVLKCDVSK